MKILKLIPVGFAQTIKECPPGHLLAQNKYVGFKSEYCDEKGEPEVYNEAGEYFHGDPGELVIPLSPEWEEQ